MIRSLHTIITANYVLFTGGILRNNFCNSVQRPINNSRQLLRNWQSLVVGRNSRALQGCTSHSAESLNSILAARRIRSPRDTAIPVRPLIDRFAGRNRLGWLFVVVPSISKRSRKHFLAPSNLEGHDLRRNFDTRSGSRVITRTST